MCLKIGGEDIEGQWATLSRMFISDDNIFSGDEMKVERTFVGDLT